MTLFQKTAAAALANQATQPPAIPVELSQEDLKLIVYLLGYRPDGRDDAADALQARLRAVLANQPTL